MDDDSEALRRRMDALFREISGRLGLGPGRQPRFRFYEIGQTKYCWTTEPFPDGRWASFVYRPEGKGSRDPRGGWRAASWKPTQEVRHSTRRAAKARALRLYAAAGKRRGPEQP